MVLADLEGRLAALRTQLCPPRIYLELQDQAITAMALEGRQVRWLERLPLPEGVCRHGVPLVPLALGDLIGDWLLERGYGGAQVKAVLPPSACSWRVLEQPPGLNSDGLQTWAEGMAEQLGLVWAEGGCAQDLDLLCEPLANGQEQVLLVTVARVLLEGWFDVMEQAGCGLAALQPACLCGWNALVPLRIASAPVLEMQGLFLVGHQQSWLSLLASHHPVGQWCLPGVEGMDGVLDSVRFLMRSAVGAALGGAPSERQALLLVADGVEPELIQAWITTLSEALTCEVRLVDPLQMGWLQWAETSQMGSGTAGVPWLLWGLAAPDLQASSP